MYGPFDARSQVATMAPQISDVARRYDLDPVLASEIDFDTDTGDVAQNIAARLGIDGGQGPGAANVHLDQLEPAKKPCKSTICPAQKMRRSSMAASTTCTNIQSKPLRSSWHGKRI